MNEMLCVVSSNHFLASALRLFSHDLSFFSIPFVVFFERSTTHRQLTERQRDDAFKNAIKFEYGWVQITTGNVGWSVRDHRWSQCASDGRRQQIKIGHWIRLAVALKAKQRRKTLLRFSFQLFSNIMYGGEQQEARLKGWWFGSETNSREKS